MGGLKTLPRGPMTTVQEFYAAEHTAYLMCGRLVWFEFEDHAVVDTLMHDHVQKSTAAQACTAVFGWQSAVVRGVPTQPNLNKHG